MNIKTYCFFCLWMFAAASNAGTDPKNLKPEGIRKMALGYEHGRGVRKNYQKAFDLYCQAALKGDAQAAYYLGFMHFNGRGIPKNLAIAMHWFKQSAKGGDKYAKKMAIRFRGVSSIEDKTCKPEPELKWVENPNRKIVRGWVEKIAPSYGIDPGLVMAVIQAESSFNPSALSNKNAQGLMQLIPATAKRFGVKDTFNPIQNIHGGTAYLSWLMKHFAGNVEWVLAAYNAGEGAVERYQGVPPYQETQHYVKKILRRYQKTEHPIPHSSQAQQLAANASGL